jgi:hypothetical protein
MKNPHLGKSVDTGGAEGAAQVVSTLLIIYFTGGGSFVIKLEYPPL